MVINGKPLVDRLQRTLPRFERRGVVEELLPQRLVEPPVRAGSPNRPSRSLRSWNASPSGSPYAERPARGQGSAAASKPPMSRGCSTVHLAVL
jgi:hypothetical protein